MTSSVKPSSPIWLRSTIAQMFPSSKVRGGLRRLPHLSLVELLVAEQDPDPDVVEASQPRRLGHPDADRQPVAERARGEVDSRDAPHVRVIAERIAQPRVLVEQLRLDVAALGQQRIHADRDMSLGQDQPISLGPVRILASRITPEYSVASISAAE